MLSQVRSTGGIWVSYGGVRCVIDPGPGSLARICSARPKLDASALNAIFVTHKHLDHSTDVNVVAEAMTFGGFDKRGAVILPDDCVHGDDPVFLKYMEQKVGRCIVMEDKAQIRLGKNVTVEPVAHVHHGVDCFGLIFKKPGLPTWGVISDTKPLDTLQSRYRDCWYISINATFPNKKPRLDHMSVEDVGELLEKIHPKLATLTHLGMMLVEHNPEQFAAEISTKKTCVLAAVDGMVIDLESLKVMAPYEEEPAEQDCGAPYTEITG
jgi:ribonuclease BN (tRNA processing enzyme)